jgi:hypothetical protein
MSIRGFWRPDISRISSKEIEEQFQAQPPRSSSREKHAKEGSLVDFMAA